MKESNFMFFCTIHCDITKQYKPTKYTFSK